MTAKNERAAAPKKSPRESDNPIVEEFKDDLLSKPGYSIHSGRDDDARLARLEKLSLETQERLQGLEKRIRELEVKR
jgi:hypothetical protein